MSKISELHEKIHTLGEIEGILGAMKNLALIEMNKVSRMISAQINAAETIAAALFDFESFYRKDLMLNSNPNCLCLLFGSERGFCGPFNERVIEAYRHAIEAKNCAKVAVIGRKLATKLEGKIPVELTIDGPNSADEIPAVVGELAERLLPYAGLRWLFIHNDSTAGGMISFPLENRAQAERPLAPPLAPLLYMKPAELYPQLLEQHLFMVMNRALYTSFLSENQERLRHMEGALDQIQKDRSQLMLKVNSRRQDEITEELEILMMNVSAGGSSGHGRENRLNLN